MKIDLSNNNASAATVGLAAAHHQQQSHQQLQQKRKQQSFIDKYNKQHQVKMQANSRNNPLPAANGPENHTVGALPRGSSSNNAKHQTNLSNNELMMQNMQNNSHLISQVKHQQTGSVVIQPTSMGQGPGAAEQLELMQAASRNPGAGLGAMGNA